MLTKDRRDPQRNPCRAGTCELLSNPVMADSAATCNSTDLTWDETHHLLVPLLRANNHTNIAFVLAEYVGLIASLAGCIWVYASWSAGQLATALFLPLAGLGVI